MALPVLDPDKTRKIETIKRLVSKDELIAIEAEKLKRYELCAQNARDRLKQLGVAA